MTTQLKIEGMSCGHCVNGVKSALLAVSGVESVSLTLETAIAEVRHEVSTQMANLTAAVEEEGYSATVA